MAFDISTYLEQIERMHQNLESRVAEGDSRLPGNVLFALVNAVVGAINEIHQHLKYVAKQVVPDLADDDYLLRYGDWKGVTRNPAAAASGNIDMAGNNGTTVPAGTKLTRSDGVLYTVTADATVDITLTVSVNVVCDDVGQSTNALQNVILTLVSPISGMAGTGVVDSDGLSGGADIESIESYRERVRDRDRNPPHGGSRTDYIDWCLDVSGVTRAWAFENYFGVGTVGIFFMRDDDVNPIPDSGEVATVQAYIDTVRPVGMAGATVFAPTAAVQNLLIGIEPASVAVQNAVTLELQDFFTRTAEVEDGAGNGKISISKLRDAIQHAEGLNEYIVSIPSGDISVNAGEIATLGNVVFSGIG